MQHLLVVLADAWPVSLLLLPEVEEAVRCWDVRRRLFVLEHFFKTFPLFKHLLAVVGGLGRALARAHGTPLAVAPVQVADRVGVLRHNAVRLLKLIFEFSDAVQVKGVLLVGYDVVPPGGVTVELVDSTDVLVNAVVRKGRPPPPDVHVSEVLGVSQAKEQHQGWQHSAFRQDCHFIAWCLFL